jgi:hypothetical protein
MACTADKIIEQLIRLFFAILCVGGFIWVCGSTIVFYSETRVLQLKKILLHIIVFKHLIMQILIQNNCDSVYFITNILTFLQI